jgi:hypothetical protein
VTDAGLDPDPPIAQPPEPPSPLVLQPRLAGRAVALQADPLDAQGGCVLAPLSRHITGGTYRWLVDLDQAPLAEVPAALRARLDPDRPTRSRPAGPAAPAAPGHPYGRRVLAAEPATLGRATPGQRNHTLNHTAFKVYRYVAGGILDDQDVTLAFTTTALAIGLNRAEISRTLASARTAGLTNPRTVPTAPDVRIGEDGS